MHRVTAILSGIALCQTLALGRALHAHDYAGHIHPEHHHGLAAHHHDRHAQWHNGDGEETLHVEACEPGMHRVAAVFLSSAPSPIHHADTVFTLVAAGYVPPPTPATAAVLRDVRVHGPPPRTPESLRGPPPVSLA